MWVVERDNKKFKFHERYTDPYTLKSKIVSVTLDSRSTHAQKKAQKILNERINKILNTKIVDNLTFSEVKAEWFKGYRKTIRPSSLNSTKSALKIIDKHIQDDILIDKLDARFIQNIFNDLDYSDDYLLHIKSLLNQIFEYAEDKNMLTTNPMPKVKVKAKAKTLEDYERIENKYLEKDEAEKLIQELYRSGRTYRLGRLAEFLYLTGARIGEAVILKPSDIINSQVHITGTIDYTNGYKLGVKGPTKTIKSNRVVSLTERCTELINKSIQENTLNALEHKYVDRGFIFTTKSGTPIQTNSFNLALQKAGKRVGIDKHLTSHIFRHTHVSLLAEQNIPLKAIMDRIGHEDAEITNKIYTHVTEHMRYDTLDVLNKIGL